MKCYASMRSFILKFHPELVDSQFGQNTATNFRTYEQIKYTPAEVESVVKM